MDVRSLIFDVSDEIHGWGRLLRAPDGDWFDPPLPVTMVGNARGRPLPPPSGYAIPIEGADFDAVEFRTERDGVIEGHATIVGRWLGNRIEVHHQSVRRPEHPVPLWSDPPCQAPPGGWPQSLYEHQSINRDLGTLEETGAAVMVAIFRPSPNQAVLVVAATDVAAVEAQLRPQLPDQLCVVASRCTRAALEAAQAHLHARLERWGVYGNGRSCDEQGQAVIIVDLVRVTDEIARWAETQPAGMVVLKPCLTPVGGRVL